MHAESERKRVESGDARADATGSSSTVAAAIARGSQLVAAPVRSIASYLWPASSPGAEGGAAPQPEIGPPPSSLPTNGASTSSGAGGGFY